MDANFPELTQRVLTHHDAIKWNTLPDYCKSVQALNAFKSVVLKYIFVLIPL